MIHIKCNNAAFFIFVNMFVHADILCHWLTM